MLINGWFSVVQSIFFEKHFLQNYTILETFKFYNTFKIYNNLVSKWLKNKIILKTVFTL